jgi:hypothetical protein
MVGKEYIFYGILMFLVVVSLGFGSAFVLNGTVYDVNGNALNNTNVSIQIRGNQWSDLGRNITTTNENGWFELNVSGQISDGYMYQLSLVHRNSTTNEVDWVSQSLPTIPLSPFLNLVGNNYYLVEAATMNITVVNRTGQMTSSYATQVKDTSLGYPVECSSSGLSYICYVPKDKNYSVMIYPSQCSGPNCEHFVPVSFNWNNFSSSSSYNFGRSSYNHTTKTVHKMFNITESFAWVSGYVQNSSGAEFAGWTTLTVVPLLLEPGNMIFMQYGKLPFNISSWRGDGFSDNYNLTSGWFNITLPYSSAENVNYLLFVAGKKGGNFYGSYRNLTMGSEIIDLNFSMYGLLGSENNITMSDSSGGQLNISTAQQTFNLVNTTNASLSQTSAHIETKVDYSLFGAREITFMNDVNPSGSASFSVPLINITGIKEINIYSKSYAPKKLVSRSVAQIVANSNITLKAFQPGEADSGQNIAITSLNITVYKSNSTCDVANPSAGCILRSFVPSSMQNMESNMMPIIFGGGKLSLRISFSGISVHYMNVDFMASGPPDAAFDNALDNSSTSGSAFGAAMKFGSQGPKVYDFILVAMPYIEGNSTNTGLNESAPINMSIPILYDEDWNVIWNASTNGTSTSALAGNYSYYSSRQSEWSLISPTVCINSQSSQNTSSPCFIDNSSNKIWVRIPHFSGTSPTISGSVAVATGAGSSSSSSSGSSGSSGTTSSTIYSYDEKDFSLYSSVNKILGKNDKIKIKINNESHSVTISSLTNTSTSIEVSSTTQTANLSIGGIKKFDVNADGYYDLQVTLNAITNSRADVTISYLHELIAITTPATTENVAVLTNSEIKSDEETTPGIDMSLYVFILIGIIIIVAIYFLIRTFYSKGLNSKVNVLG